LKCRVIRAACSGAITAAFLCSPTVAQVTRFDVPSEEAGKSLPELARQAGIQVIAPGEKLHGVITPGIKGVFDVSAALDLMLKETGLVAIRSPEGIVISLREPNKNEGQGKC
jgi:iron complex outermembrane receptor protein